MRPTSALRALPRFLPRALALGCAALLVWCLKSNLNYF